jgi:hypothetical protein
MAGVLGLAAALSAGGAVAAPAAPVFLAAGGRDDPDCAEVQRPCRTLSTAVAKAAPGGQVVILQTGSYGPATISGPLTIQAPPGIVAVTERLKVSAGLIDVVVLRGLTVTAPVAGIGSGIRFVSGAALHVERCVVDGWDRGIEAQDGRALFVSDTTVRNSRAAGLQATALSGTIQVSVHRSRFEGNRAGCGVDVQHHATAVVSDTVASGNGYGFCSGPGDATLDVRRCLAANNSVSGLKATEARLRVSGCLVTGNAQGLENVRAGLLETLGDNLVEGNGHDLVGPITPAAGR